MSIQPKKRGRDSVDIVAEVLRLASTEKVKRTSILYEVGMSHEMMGRYLRYMIGTKLLEEELLGAKVRYRTSDKGKQFLRLYHEMTALLRADEGDEQMVSRRIQLLPTASHRFSMR
jgi:predicted transcriptional regulator